uniref:Uncharacterized protein n=1 Tax=Haptolina ericina TaxID=156174 RepID=A0A7S3AJ64_9EUKA
MTARFAGAFVHTRRLLSIESSHLQHIRASVSLGPPIQQLQLSRASVTPQPLIQTGNATSPSQAAQNVWRNVWQASQFTARQGRSPTS